MLNIPRSEHPKPQFQRDNWVNLNGEWQFQIDNELSGEEKGWYDPQKNFSEKITVPFCPESALSGIEHKDFMYGVWYKRTFTLTEKQIAGRVFIHFGAVDYEATVYINGKKACTHKGGYVSFKAEITKYVVCGENTVTVFARDDVRSGLTPRGKQSDKYHSYACLYTRTTGIWQTVWLEFTEKNYVKNIRMYTEIASPSVTLITELSGSGKLEITASYEGKTVGSFCADNASGSMTVNLPLSEKHLWEPGHGRLYDLEIRFCSDIVKSYFGLRTVKLDGMKFLINGKTVFQRLVLDQGFYPDGIYTAPSDEALLNDIKLSLAMGFNGARLHEKVFEERFLYYCDKMGYIVWGEYPDWGCNFYDPKNIYSVLPEWMEEVNRDFNHPAIIGWCPHNETGPIDGKKQYEESIRLVYKVTKALDSTRPCIDTSGYVHFETDIFDTHDYEQNTKTFRKNYEKLITDGELYDGQKDNQKYEGQPIFISEYGGIQWSEDKNSWGYGNAPKTPEEFKLRFKELTEVLMQNEKIFALCYTQLTDVEQEQNGLYTYNRQPKFEPEFFKDILSQKAAIEEE